MDSTLKVLALLSVLLMVSCSASKEPKTTYGFASRQLTPDPIYNRLKLVNLPYVKPERDIEDKSVSQMTASITNITLNAASKNLDELARDFGSASKYSAYCASSIADKRIAANTPNLSGSIDEIAEQISFREGIKVVIDHQSREIRFLAAIPEAKLP